MNKRFPFVSIIVPVYNEEKRIRRCIEALINQNYPKSRYEILIVDNCSLDNTRDVVEEYPVKLLVEEKIQSSYAARNKGIQNARGEILAFTDADAKVSDNWLEDGVNTMIKYNCEYVGCRVKLFKNGHGLTYWDLYDLTVAFPVERYIRYDGFAPTVGLFVKKSLIERVGMFDPRLISSGDDEFGHRVRDAGFKQFYSEKAIVYHPTRSTLEEQIKKALRLGQGNLQLSVYYPERYGKPIWNLLNPLNILPPIWRGSRTRILPFKIILMGWALKLCGLVGRLIAFVHAKDCHLD